MLDLVNATTAQTVYIEDSSIDRTQKSNIKTFKTVSDYLDQANEQLTDRFESLKAFMNALGDDVQIKTLKYYIAFKRRKNFACVEVMKILRKLNILSKNHMI